MQVSEGQEVASPPPRPKEGRRAPRPSGAKTSDKYPARTPITTSGPPLSRTAEEVRWALSSEPWAPLRETMRPQVEPGNAASTAAPSAAQARILWRRASCERPGRTLNQDAGYPGPCGCAWRRIAPPSFGQCSRCEAWAPGRSRSSPDGCI
eukprot:5798313-Pyramimonas_sp.AAC.1